MIGHAGLMRGDAVLISGMPWAKRPVEGPGIALASSHALIEPGALLTVQVYIFNNTAGHLSGMVLQPQSFTNASMETLDFVSLPTRAEMALPDLAPGAFLTRTFSYRATDRDANDGGLVIAALAIFMDTPEGRFKVAEGDVLVQVNAFEGNDY